MLAWIHEESTSTNEHSKDIPPTVGRFVQFLKLQIEE